MIPQREPKERFYLEWLIISVGLLRIFCRGAHPLDLLLQVDPVLALSPILQAYVLLFHVTLFLSNNSELYHHLIYFPVLHRNTQLIFNEIQSTFFDQSASVCFGNISMFCIFTWA